MQVYQPYVAQPMMTPTDVIGFVDGLVFGLIQKEDLPEIQTCLQHAPEIADQLTQAISDLEKKDFADIIKAIGEFGAIIQELPQDLSDCEAMQGDIKRIENWAQIFTHPTELIATLTKNVISNWGGITTDINKVTTDFSSSDFKGAGEDIADVLVLSLGPVPEGKWWSKWTIERS